MKNIENKYQKKGIDMPENVRIQYDNTKEKLQELQEIYKKKLNEVEVLKKTKS
ncbi:MAG: hypothetical protein LUE97_04065 [Oscillospiraceae bacterium]|nr:hypothetical protein [Oscillospiraceae bacterium]MCD8067058.1 hypothetical protein [Oscillospiraceae bacterium]